MNENLRDENFIICAIEQHGDAVFRLAFCRTKNKTEAEDIYQEVFLKLLRDTTAFEGEQHLKAWLLRVTANLCKDLFKSGWFRKKTPIDEVIERGAEQQYDAEIWTAVCALPSKERMIFHLFYEEGYKTEEIADMLALNHATVRTRLRRARERLKLELKEYQYE